MRQHHAILLLRRYLEHCLIKWKPFDDGFTLMNITRIVHTDSSAFKQNAPIANRVHAPF